jgi:hypothetical protein
MTLNWGGYSQDGSVGMDLTVNGVPWFPPEPGGYYQAGFTHTVNIAGPGIYTGNFDFFASYYGLPITAGPGSGAPCDTCIKLDFLGQSTWTLDVVQAAKPTTVRGGMSNTVPGRSRDVHVPSS